LERINKKEKKLSLSFKEHHQDATKYLEKYFRSDFLFPENQAFQSLLTDIHMTHGESLLLTRFASFIVTLQGIDSRKSMNLISQDLQACYFEDDALM
jgi:hypothetical protein